MRRWFWTHCVFAVHQRIDSVHWFDVENTSVRLLSHSSILPPQPHRVRNRFVMYLPALFLYNPCGTPCKVWHLIQKKNSTILKVAGANLKKRKKIYLVCKLVRLWIWMKKWNNFFLRLLDFESKISVSHKSTSINRFGFLFNHFTLSLALIFSIVFSPLFHSHLATVHSGSITNIIKLMINR